LRERAAGCLLVVALAATIVFLVGLAFYLWIQNA
jgi:hypothetical protein